MDTPVTSRTILVVDDEHNHRLLCKIELEDDGHSVLQAATGREAMKIARHFQPDIVVLDLFLPDMDGAEVIRDMESAHLGIPVIVYSGSERAATDCRPAARLMKSSNLALLKRTVREVLSNHCHV